MTPASDPAARTKHVGDFQNCNAQGRKGVGVIECVICGRVLTGDHHRTARFLDGESVVLHPDDYGREDCSFEDLPIGPDCAKRIGEEWTKP